MDCTKLRRVTAEEVTYWIENGAKLAGSAPGLPSNNRTEWGKDHSEFFLCRVLPLQDLPLKVRRIVVEAYLAGGEAYSDGSSVVPDSQRYGYTKDWQGVAHDYVFYLKHWGLKDAFGHEWSFYEANDMYRTTWISDGQAPRGSVWRLGLTLFAWPVWREYTDREKALCFSSSVS